MIAFLGGRHTKLRSLLSAYIDGQVSDSERARVDRHLEECRDCRFELETLTATVDLLGQLPQVRTARSFALTEEPERVPSVEPFVWAARVVAPMAAVFLVVLVLGDVFGVVTQRRGAGELAVATETQFASVPDAEAEVAPQAALPAAAPAPSEGETVEVEAVKEVVREVEMPATAAKEAVVEKEVAAAPAAAAPPLPTVEAQAAVPAPEVEAAQVPPDDRPAEATAVPAVAAAPPPTEEAPSADEGVEAIEPETAEIDTGVRSVERLRAAPEEDDGLELPLWQLEAGIAGLILVVVLAGFWAAQRRRRLTR